MRRRDHEAIVAEKDRTIRRLERQVEQLLDRLTYALNPEHPWTPPPLDPVDDEPEVEHEDPDFPGFTSREELVGF